MAAGVHPGSAEIVPFPVKGGRRNFGQRMEDMQASVVQFPERVIYDVVDTCWYHADAMAEEDKSRN